MVRSAFYRHYLGEGVVVVVVEEVLQEDHKLLDVSPNHQESVPPRPTRLKLHGE